jgi:hypothetical protein
MTSPNFPFSGFNVFIDNIEEELDLLDSCRTVTLSEFNNSIANSNDCLSVLHLNCCSLLKKQNVIEVLLSSFSVPPELCLFSETWLRNSSIPPTFTGYTGFHQPRLDRTGGGVSIYVKTSLSSSDVVCPLVVSSFEYIAKLVHLTDNSDILVLCVYRPPSTDVNVFVSEYDSLLSAFSDLLPNVCKWIIGGDFNINLLSLSDCSESFVNTSMLHCLYPTIFCATRPSSSTSLDNIFLSFSTKVNSFVLSVDISDHLPIITRFNASSDQSCLSNCRVLKRNFSQSNQDKFHNLLSQLTWDEVYDSADVNVAYDNFRKDMQSCFELAFPLIWFKKSEVKFKQPWFTAGLLTSSKEKSRLYKLFLRGKIDKIVYTKYRNAYNTLIRKTKEKYFSDFFEKNKKNTRAVWHHINSTKSNISHNPPTSDPIMLNNFFANLGPNATKNLPNRAFNYLAHVPYCNHDFVLKETNVLEVINICRGLKPKRSFGIDNISSLLLQSVIDLIAAPLAYIFNMSFQLGAYPEQLKIAKVTPVFKGGDSSKLSNYRPISLLNSVSKILEKLMHNRMVAFLTEHSLISKRQFGFQSGKNTSDAVADVVNFVTNRLNERDDIGALFIDVAKAFDSISHSITLHKLSHYGFRGATYSWFKSYLSGRLQYVECNGTKSSFHILRAGVPQGSILGPLIFLLYINDLPLSCPDAHFVLFADDTTVLTLANNL